MSGTPIYRGFERFWHWSQAALILFLAVTGFEVHGSFVFLGYEQAVRYHQVAALTFLGLVAFAIFWHFTTGEWRQYVPTRELLRAYAEYYVVGIFRRAPHPSRKTALVKLNPLQRIVYLWLKLLVIPASMVTGLLYLFYRYPQRWGMAALDVDGLRWIAVTHTGGAFLLLAFVITHVYLTTTGDTPAANLRAMITGHDGPAGDGEDPEAQPPVKEAP